MEKGIRDTIFVSKLEEDKRATTNVQNGLAFSFCSLKKSLNFKKGKSVKSVEECEKVPKRFCPLVVALWFFSEQGRFAKNS